MTTGRLDIYGHLDGLIVDAVAHGRSPYYDARVCAVVAAICAGAWRDEFKVVNGRLRALRRVGRLQKNGRGPWRVPEES